ncbi:MAG: cyclic nucleotide-binding domain-containing protein [Elusimicrobiales bacterium]|nr:cyclic nucleotide-binding domain-containing protein [Elusimicrobiales bacterium]HPO95965.1 cyclic nucleotide-binding domain-containing protein [Elusimicrobiales bacterium]
MILDRFFNKAYDHAVLEKIKFLSQISLFKNIRRKDLLYILENLYEKKYLKNEVLFNEGDIGRALFIIYSGNIGLYKKNGDQNILFSEVKAGDFIGEMALLEEMPRSLSAICLEDSFVFLLYKTNIENMINSKPKIAARINYNLAKILSSRLRNTLRSNEK